MNLQELKARAYDLIAMKEQAQNEFNRVAQPIQNELNQINNEIAKIYEAENNAKKEAAQLDNEKSTKSLTRKK